MTTQALTAIVGSQVLKQEEMSRLVSWPVMKLRPYFQVTNSYVSKKLAILLFPFGHKVKCLFLYLSHCFVCIHTLCEMK